MGVQGVKVRLVAFAGLKVSGDFLLIVLEPRVRMPSPELI
jgi:hypothetical protein